MPTSASSILPTGSPAAQRAVWTPGRPSSATASMPESSPSAHAPESAYARPNRALILALSSNVAPSSGGGSSRPSASTSSPGNARRSSSSLCGLPEARISRGRDTASRAEERRRLAGLALRGLELGDAAGGEIEQAVEQLARERVALG